VAIKIGNGELEALKPKGHARNATEAGQLRKEQGSHRDLLSAIFGFQLFKSTHCT